MQQGNAYLWIHRYVGLAAALLLSVLGLSGSILVFRPELERMAKPDFFIVTPEATRVPVDELQEIAKAAVPELELYRVRLLHDEHTAYEFMFGVGGVFTTRVHVDPYRRRVLGTRTPDTDFFLWLQLLHFDLLAGTKGRQINGGVAMALLVLAASGLLLWLRSGASWTARLRPRLRVRPARRNWGLHVAMGFWGMPFLSLMGSSALYFAFHEPVAHLVYAATLSEPPAPPPTVPIHPGSVRLDLLLERARSLEPSARFTVVRLPRAAGQPVTVNYELPGDLSDLGANAIYFDPHTGAALRLERLRDKELGPRIVAALVPLHFGTFGGTPTRVLWAVLGFLPTMLLVTGWLMWWRRRARKSRALASHSSKELQLESLLESRKP